MFAPRHFGTGPGQAWVEQQKREEQEATNLSREIEAIRNSPAYGADTYKSCFWRLVEITLEMAKRIEELERCEHSHPLGVGSLAQRRSE